MNQVAQGADLRTGTMTQKENEVIIVVLAIFHVFA